MGDRARGRAGELRNPVMIAAFEGWNDAGGRPPPPSTTSSTSGTPSPSRPSTPRTTTTSRSTAPASSSTRAGTPHQPALAHHRRILLATTPGIDRDVILVQGISPSFRWRAFTIELMEFAHHVGVTAVFTLGALMADVAHTRPIPVTATSDSDDVLHRYDLEPSKYEGPTGIVGVLADAATQARPAVHLVLGRGAALRRTLPVPEGHARPDRRGAVGLPHPAQTARAWERGINERGDRRGGRGVRPVPRGGPGHRGAPRGQRRLRSRASSSATCADADRTAALPGARAWAARLREPRRPGAHLSGVVPGYRPLGRSPVRP